MKGFYFHLVLFLLCSKVGWSQGDSYYLLDRSSSLSFEDVRKETKWTVLKNSNTSFGFQRKECVWLRVHIPKKKVSPNWYLEIPNSSIDSITCYQGSYRFVWGDRVAKWSIKSTYPAFPVKDTVIYLRIKKEQSFLSVPVQLRPYHLWQEMHDFELLKSWFAIGVFSVFFLFNLTLFINNRKKVFGLFSLHVLLTVVYYLISNGFLKTYIASDFLYFSEIRLYLACSSPISFYFFISHLIDTHVHSPRLSKMGNWLAILNASIVGLSLIAFQFFSNFLAFEAITTLYLLNTLLILLLILMSFQTIRAAGILHRLSAFVFLVSMGIILVLFSAEAQLLAWLPKFDVLLLISAIEIIVFGIIIAFNFFRTFQENEQLALSLLKERIEANKALAIGEVRERKRISSVLHDYYQSRLTAIRLMMMHGEQTSSSIEKDILQLETDLRHFSHQLMPRELEEGHLISAMEERLKQIEKAHPTWKTELFSFDFPEFMNETWVFDLFLILNELIQNSLKHSKGNLLGLECYAHEEEFQFIVYDNGSGLSSGISDFQGIGLTSIKERVALYGGNIFLESSEEDGVRATIQLPRT
jgi:signal transduction histidine kinase